MDSDLSNDLSSDKKNKISIILGKKRNSLCILSLLQKRNLLTEGIKVIYYYNVIIKSREEALKEKIKSLTYQVSNLVSSNEKRNREILLESESTLNTISQSKLNTKIQQLQEDLNQNYKRNLDNTQTIIKTEEEKKRLERETESRKNEIIVLKNNIQLQKEKIRELTRDIGEKNLLLNVWEEEINLLKNSYKKTDKRCNILKIENLELSTRLKQHVNTKVEILNEENKEFKSWKKSKTIDKTSKSVLDFNDHTLYIQEAVLPGKLKRCFTGHKGEITDVSFNETSTLFATGSNDKTIKLWDAKTCLLKTTLSGPVRSVMCVKFSPNNDFVLGTSNDNVARIWNISQRKVVHSFIGHIGRVYTAGFTPNYTKIVTGSYDRSLKIWDIKKGFCIKTIFCASSCNGLCISKDGGNIISGHLDGKLRFWDFKNNDCVHSISDIHSKQITSISLANDGKTLLTNSRDNTLKLIDTRTFETIKHSIIQIIEMELIGQKLVLALTANM